ncbi:MAG: hypothetical protein MZV70_44910 [Desulfobacterales bacterium]|nr:hypothetical protein [Desulfobacterales bacterium]
MQVYDYQVEAQATRYHPDADKNPYGMMAITIRWGANPDRGSILFANAWSES